MPRNQGIRFCDDKHAALCAIGKVKIYLLDIFSVFIVIDAGALREIAVSKLRQFRKDFLRRFLVSGVIKLISPSDENIG